MKLSSSGLETSSANSERTHVQMSHGQVSAQLVKCYSAYICRWYILSLGTVCCRRSSVSSAASTKAQERLGSRRLREVTSRFPAKVTIIM